MSKRDDDSQSDMEVGMTTAERRRRRRRGGGLRVPSDNVPRRSSTPPVVAPVPEDPSLAMSIAYSFTNDSSEPVQRVTLETPVPTFDQLAPEQMETVIDPPSAPVEAADFEMKTREMTAVDLEALGLSEHAPSSVTTTDPKLPGVEVRFKPKTTEPPKTVPAPAPTPEHRASDIEIEVEGLEANGAGDSGGVPAIIEVESSSGATTVAPIVPPKNVRERKERLKTVALTDEDLEEVREAVRAATQPSAPPTPETSKTIPLAPMDIEPEKSEEQIIGSGEIDITELERAAESSGEIEVSITDDELKSGPMPLAAKPPEPIAARTKSPSSPPPIAPPAASTNPGVHVDKHPPPVPVPHKSPPTPPPPAKPRDTKENLPIAKPEAKPPAVARTSTPMPQPDKHRGKPWFADLFDEDYLRTLPFLTPQATQAEAEFVIDAMGLSPGAQVLDVGCGYGRHAMELAARGFHVVGLDLSTPLLVRGGEEAHRRGLQINFVRGDMRELDFENQFDGAYCLFSTFGYFDDETNKRTITNIARALKPNGRVMIEILNRDYLISDLPTRVWWEGDGCVVLEEVELNYFSSRIQVNRSVVFDDGRQLEQEISVRAYSLHEVGKLMHAAGFRVLEVSGGYHTRGRFFGNQSRHIIVLAERKETAPSG